MATLDEIYKHTEEKMQKASHYRWDQITGGDGGATPMVVDDDDADDCDTSDGLHD